MTARERSEALEDRIRNHDSAALGEYLGVRRPQLLAFIERNLGDGLRRKIEADDILQEVSVDCVRSLPEVDLSDRDPFSWLCQVAERRIIDAHRRFFGAQKRDAAREVPLHAPAGDSKQGGIIDLIVASITSPSQAFSRDQREFRLRHAIEQLPEESRRAIELRYGQGLPTKEVAHHLGKTDGAVRVLLTRTVKKLQQLLESA